MRPTLLLTIAFTIFLLSVTHIDAARHKTDDHIAPLISAEGMKTIPGRYIVHLKDVEIESSLMDPMSRFAIHGKNDILHTHTMWLMEELTKDNTKSRLLHTYDMENFLGYSGEFEPSLLEKIRYHPAVDFVESDQPMWTLDLEKLLSDELIAQGMESLLLNSSPSIEAASSPIDILKDFYDSVKFKFLKRKFFGSSPSATTNCTAQLDAPWGLSRVAHRDLPETFGRYVYPITAGSGVDAYIIDTGINIDHNDFDGRASWGVTIPEFDLDIDGNGHGTHCAGIVGGKTYGIAKKVNLVAVKVLRTNGFGTNADVLKGVEWVLNQHRVASRRGRRSVANMSLGGGKSLALERVVDAAVGMGIHFAVAAGNDNVDACNYSPAGAKKAITVGASTITDSMAYFSNIGPCVDIFAPGLDITSTWIGSPDATNTISGTSMAAPHVCGVLALYLGEQVYDTETLKSMVLEAAAVDRLADLPNKTPNKLLNIHSLIQSVNHHKSFRLLK
jgi:cerevisin